MNDGKKQVRRLHSGVRERQIVRCAVACFLRQIVAHYTHSQSRIKQKSRAR